MSVPDVGPTYRASFLKQRGGGLGSVFFGQIARFLRPALSTGAKILGQEAIASGGRILSNLAQKSSDQHPKEIVMRELQNSVQNLKRRAADSLKGSGKRRRGKVGRKGTKRKKTASKNKKRSLNSVVGFRLPAVQSGSGRQSRGGGRCRSITLRRDIFS